MLVQTSRFGPLDVQEEDLIHFPEGLLGFDNLTRFVLLDDPNEDIFAWLQSCEEPSVAFPVLEPEIFMESYNVNLTKSDMEAIKVSSPSECQFFVIITIPEDPKEMTANLKAPIVINSKERLAKQCVLQDNRLAIREPIFKRLQQKVVPRSSKDQDAPKKNLSSSVRPHKESEL
ncbi:MAG: flagellar assembly protein FliW [Bdellovibrio sp.]|nr:MAG: flagellar assembly protein FliW [Bdellovibrio sp.]